MKKVLATLLAVLLLTCVFGTVASAANEWTPEGYPEVPDRYKIGDKVTKNDDLGLTELNTGETINLDAATLNLSDAAAVKSYLDRHYMAKPAIYTVKGKTYVDLHKCITPEHEAHTWEVWNCWKKNCPGHKHTDDCYTTEKWWEKCDQSKYVCDDGHWEYCYDTKNGLDTVKLFAWKCEHGYGYSHNITANVTFAHTHTFEKKVKDTNKAYDATCTEPAKYYKICKCGARSQETFEVGEKDPNNHPNGEPKNCVMADENQHKFTCSACGNEMGKREDHNFVETYRKNPTIHEKGYVDYKCEKCTATKQE